MNLATLQGVTGTQALTSENQKLAAEVAELKAINQTHRRYFSRFLETGSDQGTGISLAAAITPTGAAPVAWRR